MQFIMYNIVGSFIKSLGGNELLGGGLHLLSALLVWHCFGHEVFSGYTTCLSVVQHLVTLCFCIFSMTAIADVVIVMVLGQRSLLRQHTTLTLLNRSVTTRFYTNTYHRFEVVLQEIVPGLLHRHQTITECLFAPPQDLIREQVETFEGVPQKILFHTMLLTQKGLYYHLV